MTGTQEHYTMPLTSKDMFRFLVGNTWMPNFGVTAIGTLVISWIREIEK